MIESLYTEVQRNAFALPLHEETRVELNADVSTAFAYLDDHTRFSSHMSESSWRMGGAKMEIVLDRDNGRKRPVFPSSFLALKA